MEHGPQFTINDVALPLSDAEAEDELDGLPMDGIGAKGHLEQGIVVEDPTCDDDDDSLNGCITENGYMSAGQLRLFNALARVQAVSVCPDTLPADEGSEDDGFGGKQFYMSRDGASDECTKSAHDGMSEQHGKKPDEHEPHCGLTIPLMDLSNDGMKVEDGDKPVSDNPAETSAEPESKADEKAPITRDLVGVVGEMTVEPEDKQDAGDAEPRVSKTSKESTLERKRKASREWHLKWKSAGVLRECEADAEGDALAEGASSSGALQFPAGANLHQAFTAYVKHRVSMERAANPAADGRALVGEVRRSWKGSSERAQFLAGRAGIQL